MYIFITSVVSVVSISFCILFKNMKLALFMIYIVHLYEEFINTTCFRTFSCRLKLLSSYFPFPFRGVFFFRTLIPVIFPLRLN